MLALVACATSTDGANTDAEEADAIRKYKPKQVEDFPREPAPNGFYFSGQEYWPYKEPQPLYPDKILWGYESGSEPAKKCMAAAQNELLKILNDPPKELLELRDKTGINSFFAWNNDYTGASANGMGSIHHLWLYQGRLIKWISETNRNGKCLLPERKDLRALARNCLRNYVEGQTLSCDAKDTSGLPKEN